MWIVWNQERTEGFVTDDKQLAHEVRKSADTNCCTVDGDPAPVAVAFCERWAQDNCTLESFSAPAIELLRQQLAARDAALDAVLTLACDTSTISESDECRMLRERFRLRLAGHGVHPK